MAATVHQWAGRYSGDANDPGNWTGGERGVGRLVGSMYDVTPEVLAKHRGISVDTITVETMQTVTPEESADISVTEFYNAPHFDLLTWAPATADLLDFGWGSGTHQVGLSLQRLAGLTGADVDGVIGPHTVAAYNAWHAKVGTYEALQATHKMRVAFYDMLSNNPNFAPYHQGWLNRAQWTADYLARYT